MHSLGESMMTLYVAKPLYLIGVNSPPTKEEAVHHVIKELV